MTDDLPGLDHYALKSMDYGQLTGLAIACHAIPGCFLLMHVGVGCKNKATAHLLVHDWREHANLREAWTEVGDQDLILGASDRAGPYLRSWVKRMDPELVVTTSVTFLALAGEDLEDKVTVAAQDVPCPVWHVKAPGYDPDLYLGYAKLVLQVVSTTPWSTPPDRPDAVTILGYPFDRYEGDHEGNLKQMEGLLKLAGLEMGPVLLSGKPLAELQQAHRCAHAVALPYLGPVRKKVARKMKGRDLIDADLPMGLAATTRWVRTIAEAAGRWTPRLAQRLAQREAYALAQVDTMLDRWRSQSVVVVAEPPLAAGLCGLLLELGFHVELVGLRGSTLGGAQAFHAAMARDGHALDETCEVLDDPSLATLRDRFAALSEAGRFDGLFGSAVDVNVLTTLAPRTHARGHVAGRLEPIGPFVVEIGFPCRDFHAMMPMPWLGYGGAVVLAQRIVDAKRVWDSGRRLTFQL